MCASACPRKTPNLRCGFRKRRLKNTPQRHALPMASSHHFTHPHPSFSSFGVAPVMMCCSARPASSSEPIRPSVVPEDRIGRKYNIVHGREKIQYSPSTKVHFAEGGVVCWKKCSYCYNAHLRLQPLPFFFSFLLLISSLV